MKPKDTMEEAWVEWDRMWAEWDPKREEGDRMWNNAYQVVKATAQALYGEDAQIDLKKHIVKPGPRNYRED